MKYLHLMPADKFTNPYIDFINNNFVDEEHFFLIVGLLGKEKVHIEERKNVKNITKSFKSLIYLIMYMHKPKSVYLHSLFNTTLIFVLFLQPWLLNRVNWIVWGGDLYHYLNRKRDLKANLIEYIRKKIIKRFGAITTLAKGDYALSKKWYNVKGKYFHGVYVNPVNLNYLNKIKPSEEKETMEKKINIQIGNSADPSNNHKEVLDILYKFKDENINIIAPLSYGNKEYATSIVNYGKKIFGEKFVPILDFLDPREYAKFLDSIDVAIFNHDRQQALGNIFALIYLEKKVYLRSDISSWNYIKDDLELYVYNINEIKDSNFSSFIELSNSNNKGKVTKLFSDDYLKNVWERIFSGS